MKGGSVPDWNAASVAELDAELVRLEAEKQSIRDRQRELLQLRDAKARVEVAMKMMGRPTVPIQLKSVAERGR